MTLLNQLIYDDQLNDSKVVILLCPCTKKIHFEKKEKLVSLIVYMGVYMSVSQDNQIENVIQAGFTR